MKLVLAGLVAYAVLVSGVAWISFYRFEIVNQRLEQCDQILATHGKFRH